MEWGGLLFSIGEGMYTILLRAKSNYNFILQESHSLHMLISGHGPAAIIVVAPRSAHKTRGDTGGASELVLHYPLSV